jgi:hypothetical protein
MPGTSGTSPCSPPRVARIRTKKQTPLCMVFSS